MSGLDYDIDQDLRMADLTTIKEERDICRYRNMWKYNVVILISVPYCLYLFTLLFPGGRFCVAGNFCLLLLFIKKSNIQ